MEHYTLTSEAVGEGHPDKLADQISDAILDAALTGDKNSRVACEVMLAKNVCIIAGEITSNAEIDYEKVARQVIIDAGYDNIATGFDGHTCQVLVYVSQQSPEISSGVNVYDENNLDSLGAGDQGIVFGYATDETEEQLPLPYLLAQRLTQAMAGARKEGDIEYLLPDNKTQVSVDYKEDGAPKQVTKVLISTQHKENIGQGQLQDDLIEKIVKPELGEWFNDDVEITINPAGPWSFGGPAADTGLTGRKIIVDTYGGGAKHGGGAFSGKDPSKVDRSGAYMARFVAKTIVTAGLAKRCEVQLSYAIGNASAFSINVDTFGTEKIAKSTLIKAVNQYFDIRPAAIIKRFDLQRPLYAPTASYGHFTRNHMPWEQVDEDAMEFRIFTEKIHAGIDPNKVEQIYEDEDGKYYLRFRCMTCRNFTIPVFTEDGKYALPGKYNCLVCGQADQYIPVWLTARANYHIRSKKEYQERGYVSLGYGPLREPRVEEWPDEDISEEQARSLRYYKTSADHGWLGSIRRLPTD